MLAQQYSQGQNVPLLPNQRVFTPPLNKQPRTFIDLNKKQKVGVSYLVSHQEKIYFAGVVTKINKRNVPQDRIIVITNKFLYNIDPEGGFLSILCSSSGGYSLQRKIAVNKIFGATVSTNPSSQQFVIHVQGDYDYLFNGGQKREKFIRSLINVHFLSSSQPFLLYCQNETKLSKYHTTDDDFYAKINRRPKDGQIPVTPDIAENGIEWIIHNRRNLSGRSNAVHPIHSQVYQPQFQGPVYPPPTNFPGAFPQNPGYPSLPAVPQWGNPMPYGHPSPMYERPSYYIPEVQPQQPEFSAPHVNINVQYQHPQNQAPIQQKEVRQGNQGNNELMTMQAKKQTSSVNDWSFIQTNILPLNSNPNPNVQIHTNFDYVYPNGQQAQAANHYNGYNNAQNQNVRGPYM